MRLTVYVYVHLSVGMIFLGMVLIPLMIPVCFYEKQSPVLAGIALMLILSGILFVVIKCWRWRAENIKSLKDFVKAMETEPSQVDSIRWPYAIILGGLLFLLGSYLPLRPFMKV